MTLFRLGGRHRAVRALLGVAVLVAAAWLLVPVPTLYGSTPFSNVVYDRDGRLLRLNLAKDQRYRLFVPLEEITDDVIDATLLYINLDSGRAGIEAILKQFFYN